MRAVRSWQRLRPRPRITLLGWETGFYRAERELGVHIERRLDQSFLGVPLFNAIVERANNSDATITVLINSDIILYQYFMTAFLKVASSIRDFLVVLARFDLDDLPPHLHDAAADEDEVRDYVWRKGTLRTYGGMDVWAWNTNGPRLFNPIMSHFVFGRGKYDNWLTHETIVAQRRHVVDISETCLASHVRNDHSVVPGSSSDDSANK